MVASKPRYGGDVAPLPSGRHLDRNLVGSAGTMSPRIIDGLYPVGLANLGSRSLLDDNSVVDSRTLLDLNVEDVSGPFSEYSKLAQLDYGSDGQWLNPYASILVVGLDDRDLTRYTSPMDYAGS